MNLRLFLIIVQLPQEWFQPPGRNSGGGPEPSPFASTSTGRGWGGEEAVGGGATDAVLNPMPSFGFEATIQEADENTSSSAEPGEPLSPAFWKASWPFPGSLGSNFTPSVRTTKSRVQPNWQLWSQLDERSQDRTKCV